MSEVNLNTAQRAAVINLGETLKLADQTSLRLSTGKKINSVTDDAVSYFRSQSLSQRATTILARKDEIANGLNSVQTAQDALTTVDTFLKQLKGIADAQKSTTTNERVSANATFRNILSQIAQVVQDSSFSGVNLLKSTSTTLKVRFSDTTTSAVSVTGFNLLNNTASTSSNYLFSNGAKVYSDAVGTINTIANVLNGLGAASSFNSFSSIGANNSNSATIDTINSTLDTTISRVRGQAEVIGAYAAIFQTRSDFNTRYASRLQNGADELVQADLNEEGAKLLALQTRIQLGTTALQYANNSRSAVSRIL